jgi:hypothetical protein
MLAGKTTHRRLFTTAVSIGVRCIGLEAPMLGGETTHRRLFTAAVSTIMTLIKSTLNQ